MIEAVHFNFVAFCSYLTNDDLKQEERRENDIREHKKVPFCKQYRLFYIVYKKGYYHGILRCSFDQATVEFFIMMDQSNRYHR